MLSAFARLKLNSGEQLIVKPLCISELKINEFSQDDLMRYFSGVDGVDVDMDNDNFKNDYYCKAVLKLTTSVTATFESTFNYMFFKLGNLHIWLKCHVKFDDNCRTSELCLTKLAIHNLNLCNESIISQCEVSEYPIYLGTDVIERCIFREIDKIVIQPVTPFPSSITSDMIDSAVQNHFKDFNFPLSLNHQLIISIDCSDGYKFAAVFKITEAEGGQFIFTERTKVYLKLKPINERIPSGLQRNLTNSIILPRKYLFSSFPESSQKLETFFNCQRFNNFSLSTALIHGPFGSGKRTLIRKLADKEGIPFDLIDLYCFYEEKKDDVIFSSTQKVLSLLQEKFSLYDNILLEGFELIGSNIKIRSIWSQISQENPNRNLKLVCINSYLNSNPISDYFLESFDLVETIKPPGTFGIKLLVKELIEFIPEAADIVTSDDFIGYRLENFVNLVETFKDKENQEGKGKVSFNEVFNEFKTIMKLQKSLQLNSLEIPKVTWDEVAGLAQVKTILKDLLLNIQKKPRPTGVLLYGPPGTGKTLIAKALATQSRFALLPVKGPELLSPYIGESESSLRNVFTLARSMSPCIIFFDELDALVPSRGEFGDSVGVADRMVATFMTEMDKINGLNTTIDEEEDCCVFVIGATNRPDLIDSSLTRKGRFDLSILLDTPKTIEERAAILEASCKKLDCSDTVDFFAPFRNCKIENDLSAAQIAAIASTASKMALERKLEQLRLNPNEDNLLIDPITTKDLIDSASKLYQQ